MPATHPSRPQVDGAAAASRHRSPDRHGGLGSHRRPNAALDDRPPSGPAIGLGAAASALAAPAMRDPARGPTGQEWMAVRTVYSPPFPSPSGLNSHHRPSSSSPPGHVRTQAPAAYFSPGGQAAANCLS